MTAFWQNKKVLLTGHTGFKGSWLSLWLQQLGAKVTGYSLAPPTTPSLFAIANVADHMQSIIGDVRDFNSLLKTITACQPDIIIHMAAQSLVRHSYDHPLDTYATNVMGTLHVFEAARQTDCTKAIINVTTDKCYENLELTDRGYREDDKLGGYDPYSNSKACSELVTAAYHSSYFHDIGIASVRAGNVIGGGDWAKDRLIPDMINALTTEQPIQLRYPMALRPWQHVLEPLSGYLLLAQKLYESPQTYSTAWNFGPNENDIQPVQWVVATMIKLWNSNITWKQLDDKHLHETHSLRLDCTKAHRQLHWQPRWHLNKGLEETVTWYKAYQNHQPMRAVTLAQIDAFSNHITTTHKEVHTNECA